MNLSQSKFSLPFYMQAYDKLSNAQHPNGRLLERIGKRIELLQTIHKCSHKISELLEYSDDIPLIETCSLEQLASSLEDLLDENGSEVPITVNVMTYNEERCIERCLSSVRELADEIIVLDTGSADRTLDIVKEKFPEAKVYTAKWTSDFATARNLMLEYSTNDWILQIDADEYLVDSPSDLKQLVQLLSQIPFEPLVISPTIVNHDDSEFHHTKRIFNKSSGLKFFGIIHEELRHDIEKRGTDIYYVMTELRFNHDGYTDQVIDEKQKYIRNKVLLERMIELEPSNIRWHYFLAREKYYLGDSREEIIDIIHQGMKYKDSGPDLDHFHLACLVLLASIYSDEGNRAKLKEITEEINHHYPYSIDGLYYELASQFEQSTNALFALTDQIFQQLIQIDDPLSFVHSQGFPMYKLLGLIYFYRGDYKLAFKLFSRITDKQEIGEIKEEMAKLRKEIDHFLKTTDTAAE